MRWDRTARTIELAVIAGFGCLAAILLHEHHFAHVFTYPLAGTDRSVAVPKLPVEKDPLALFLAIGSVTFAAGLAARRVRGLALAGPLFGLALATSLYVHQRHELRVFCAADLHSCPGIPVAPPWWADHTPMLTAGAGLILAAFVLRLTFGHQPALSQAS
jgi:hypothetical protein